MSDQFGIILQARVSSTRLPGKVLLPFYNGSPLLAILLNKIRDADIDAKIIVATSLNPADDQIEEFCRNVGVSCYRGNEMNVLQRFIDAACHNGINRIFRICSDNPFLLTNYIDKLYQQVIKYKEADYVSYRDSQGVPSIRTHWGLFAEYVSLDALRKVAKLTDDKLYHEHVTNFIYSHSELFNIQLLPAPDDIISRRDLRFTIDTVEDFEALQKLYVALVEKNSSFTLKQLLLEVERHPDILQTMHSNINSFKK